jgi:preprotein translocase subunit Sec61beta
MSNDKIQMPASTAGLTRYFDDYKSKITFKPGTVIVVNIVILVILLFLQTQSNALLNLG